jgi:hypothetical protein
MRIASLFFAALFLSTGLPCRLPAQTSPAPKNLSRPPVKEESNEIVVRLSKVRSIAEIDQALQGLTGDARQGGLETVLEYFEKHGSWCDVAMVSLARIIGNFSPAPPGQENIELLLEGWGKHGSWYDLTVVRYVWKHWPRVFHADRDDIDPLRLIPIARKRIEEQPKLVRQLFWYAQWERRGMKFKDICEVSRSPLEVDGSCVGAEFPSILFIAGAIGQPELLETGAPPGTGKATADQLCDWWIMTGYLYFRSIRPFLRYDPKRNVFTYDAAADRENRYLHPEDQEPTPPATPLPDWESQSVPQPPARKK